VLNGKRILLVISGGIAAYKCLELIRRLRERGAGVSCILTEGGAQFVTPLSVAAITEEKVYGDLFSLTEESEMGHIQLSRAADLLEKAKHALRPLPDSAAKALLSQDGGVCPDDGSALAFDPWSPEAHRCPRCGAVQRGERHDGWWARFQHLWVAERAAQLAALAAVSGHEAAGQRAAALLAAYGERYFTYPNSDNVLGPSRLFFSTYLESVWLSNYLAAATLLRAAGRLDDATAKLVSQVADEAANLIGEFDERSSNRQTWNDAALAAVAVWFDDRDLMREVVQGKSGMVVHLAEGFRPDGMWYEGENYHLFALRGLLTGLGWARVAGVDVTRAEPLALRLAAALLAPTRTALPDYTFPARKDSRFGVSLAQPMYLEIWEVGIAMIAGRGRGEEGRVLELEGWLRALYDTRAPVAETFDSYLHEADPSPFPLPPSRSRRDLSWWSLLEMLPELPAAPEPWRGTGAGRPGCGRLGAPTGRRRGAPRTGCRGRGSGCRRGWAAGSCRRCPPR